MCDFTVSEAFQVPLIGPRGGRQLDYATSWWDEDGQADYAALQGCYLFFLQTQNGTHVPIYVGQVGAKRSKKGKAKKGKAKRRKAKKVTRRTFKNECFHADKIVKCQQALLGRSGTLWLRFIAYEGHGRSAGRKIGALERFLIAAAYHKNPSIQNTHHTKSAIPDWTLEGVVGCGTARRQAVRAFHGELGLR